MSKGRKSHQIKKGEVRVIKLGFDAIAEFLWEAFMLNANAYFDLDGDNKIYNMILDPNLKTLTFAACRFDEVESVDMDVIHTSISETTDSMYSKKQRYITLHLKS